MENIVSYSKRGLKPVNVLLTIIYLVPLLTVINENLTSLSSIIIIGISILLWRTSKFYCILPIFIFFNGVLVLPGGISTYRIFSLLLLLKLLFSKKLTIDRLSLVPFFIFILYCIVIISYYDYISSAIVAFDFLLIIIYISTFIRKNISNFFFYYVFGAAISCLYGWFQQGLNINTFININNEWIKVSRFVGSFPDPNYFGFFINIAIFSVIILNIISNRSLKVMLLIFLYASLIATLSVTGYICNISMLLLYFILNNKQKIKYSFSFLIVGFFIFLNLDFLENKNYPVISDMAKRINSQLSLSQNNDFASFTTGRSSIWENHFEYFLEQPIIRILFGGNYVTDMGLDPKFNNVSHQAYIDMLLNFGLIGTLVFILFLITTTLYYLKSYYEKQNNEYLLLVMIKGVWIFYAFGLSMFPSWTFNLFFFL
ncbi:O-antigen ligase family protein [Lysinibacillus sp. LZ02]|uniref:O-antigen ligase family protein n=1 Tax=Lysinibacillus sp. LZ02 TaxID=3420668 RepID=UPI003D3650C1